MAAALVSAIMEQLVSILSQQAEEGIRLIVGADEEVQKLTSNFRVIQAVLEDAETKQVKDMTVRVWVDKLKDVCYDIDDVLDEWNTALQKLTLKQAENASKVCSIITPCCGFSYGRVVMRCDIAHKIKNLNRKLDVIAVEKDRFGFSSTEGKCELERPITTSVTDLSEVCGRNMDRTEILNFLLSESSSQGPTIPIISIIGMGGIGKTTLARAAFNDNQVDSHFEKKIWVCVSHPFDETRIAKAILESISNEAPEVVELNSVMQKIRPFIEGKKFFLVLDDVWTESPRDWEQIINLLKCGSLGSRILVTTRKENVADVIGTNKKILVGTLPEKECWEMFSRLAFHGRTLEECESLKEIGEKILYKCQGLPLAIKTLGSLLRFKRKVEEWRSVLISEIWELDEIETEVFRPLLLSYHDLPPIVRKCFSYCAIFPKDYEMEKFELIRLWMAQGYLNINQRKDPEEVGEKYFDILSMRSFFQDFEKEYLGDSRCKMHDIVHDFAQFLTKNECFTIKANDDFKKSQLENYKKARHLMINGEFEENTQLPLSKIYKMKSLHSLVVESTYMLANDNDLSKLCDQLTCLRTLELRNVSSVIKKVPRRIEKLIHLRNLALSCSSMKELPEALCELHNLQVLNIHHCWRLRRLPQGIGKLINLRCLFNWNTSISYMPKGFDILTCLRRIGDFVVSDGVGRKASKLECLKFFKDLKEVGISGLGNLADVDEAKRAQLNNKEKLINLRLDFEAEGKTNDNHQILLEALAPPPNLEILEIEHYRGNIVSPNNFIMSLTKLKRLILESCLNCEHLPPLGKLPSLEELHIIGMSSVRRVGDEFLGMEIDGSASSSSSVVAFPKLKILIIFDMIELEEWDYEITRTAIEEEGIKITIMPRLHYLSINYCAKLKSMPRHLLPLTTSSNFEIYECGLLEKYLKSVKSNGRDDQSTTST